MADSVLLSDPETGSKARSSSVLQKNLKLHGPMKALEENPSTCWNSEGNTDRHWFQVDFGRTVQPLRIGVEFQAGFVAETVVVESFIEGEWTKVEELVMDDTHALQEHDLGESRTCTSLRLWLDDCTDFYGRVTIYRLQVWGTEA